MKKIQYILMGLAAVAMAASCSLNQLEEPVKMLKEGEEIVFTALAPGAEGTKTMVSEAGPEILWSPGDQILIFSGKYSNIFTSTNEEPAARAMFSGWLNGFSGSIENQAEHEGFWAVYPGDWNNVSYTTEGGLKVLVPYAQNLTGGSFDPKALVTVARSHDLQLGFYNICGGVKFKLATEGIQQVELKANGGETLSGTVSVQMDKDGFPEITKVEGPSSSVILTAAYGESFEPGTWYYLPCLPAALSEGWTLTFRSETKTGVLEHPAAAEVKRSVWGSLDGPDAGVTFEDADNAIWYNVIRYTTSDGNVLTPMNSAYFGDEYGSSIVSNTYENGQGILHFDRAVTRIPSNAFYNMPTLVSITLPGSVRVIESSAFYNNVYDGAPEVHLKEVRLNEGLQTIGSYVFSGSALETLYVPGSVRNVTGQAFIQCRKLRSLSGPLATEDGRGLIVDGTLVAAAPADLTEYAVPEGVKALGDYVFYQNQTLTAVTLPEGCKVIGNSAFEGASNLASVTFPADCETIGRYAFSNCRNLTSVAVPEGVEFLGAYAFQGCTNLEEATLPGSLKEIGVAVFLNDTKLRKFSGPLASEDGHLLVFDGTLMAVAPAELTEIIVPGAIKSIAAQAFNQAQELKKVSFEEGVEQIGERAFAQCPNLEVVSLPSSLVNLGPRVFENDLNLKQFSGKSVSADGRCVVMDGSVVAFAPAGLTAYTIPEDVTGIGDYAFYYCQNLTEIAVPSSVTRIGNYAFYRTGITSLTLPEGLKELGTNSFGYCQSLQSLTVPASLPRIGERAFYGCSVLSSVSLPEGLQEIGQRAFYNCNALTSITVPSTVTWVGSYAFSARNLTQATLLPTVPPTLQGYLFYDNSKMTINVPAASLDAYRNANVWNQISSDQFKPISE